MKLSKLNESLTLVANVGVIAGIVFLAIEIQQNTDMMKAQTRDSLSGKLMDWQMMVADSDSLAALYRKGNQQQELNEDSGESFRYRSLIQSNLRLWENEWYQFEMGLFEEEEFLARTERWKDAMGIPGYKAVWSRSRESYSPSFRETLDSFNSQ